MKTHTKADPTGATTTTAVCALCRRTMDVRSMVPHDAGGHRCGGQFNPKSCTALQLDRGLRSKYYESLKTAARDCLKDSPT